MRFLLYQPFYWRLLVVAAVLHFCAAWFSLGHYGLDEHTQILDFAAYKMGDVPAENLGFYSEKMRSAVQPFMVYGIMQILPDNAGAPFLATFVLRLLSVVLSFAASLAFFLAYQNDLKDESARRWVLAAMLLCWTLLFYHARFSSEGWAASFLLLAFAFLRRHLFLAGVFFGLAFAVRYQTGFMLLPLALWMLLARRDTAHQWREAALLLAGGVCALLVELPLNAWLYGEAVLPWVNYLLFHVSLNAAGSNVFESSPWLYWTNGGSLLPPLGYALPVVWAAFCVKFPRHPLVWASVLYVAFHLWTENRQLRFMYPLLVFMPYITAMVWQEVIAHRAVLRRLFLWLLKISAVINAPLIAYAAFHPAALEIRVLRDCILPNMRDDIPVYHSDEKHMDNIRRQFYLRGKVMTMLEDGAALREQVANGETGEALYISSKPRDAWLEENGISHARLCSGLPDWILRFDFNNWTSRSYSYPVYRLRVE